VAWLRNKDEKIPIFRLATEAAKRCDRVGVSAAVRMMRQLPSWDAPAIAAVATNCVSAGLELEGERLLGMALAKKPSSHVVQREFGKYFLNLGDAPGSLRYLEKAVALCPDDAEAFFLCGNARLMLRDPVSARQCYEKSIELNRYNVGYPYVGLACVASAESNWQEAIQWWREATDRLPEDQSAWLGLGNALIQAGKYWQAIEPLERALRCAGGEAAFVLHDLALAHLEIGEVDAARTYCEQGLRIDPSDGQLRGLKGRIEDDPTGV
jgi:tetratricopeptide (TPR) repeat protein